MKYQNLVLSFIFCCCCLLILGCSNESSNNPPTNVSPSKKVEVSQSDILGRWEIEKATRNNRPTESLDRAFFEFKNNGSMLTNLLGEEQELGYRLTGNTILQEGSQELKYIVESISRDKMTLSMAMSGFNFRFQLAKTQ